MSKIYLSFAAAVALNALSSHAAAETYCVGTAAQLRTALSDAATSVAASEIHIRVGTYSLPAASAGGISLQYTGNSDLTITGGWTGNNGLCTDGFSTQEMTILSADGVGRLFSTFIQAGSATNITMRYLSFRNGSVASGTGSACVTVDSDVGSDGVLRIENSTFRQCDSEGGGGSALKITARSLDVYLRNNLFANNANSAGAVYLQGLGSSMLYVSNNTVVSNPQSTVVGGQVGVQIAGQPSDLFWFSNNVLWNNGGGNGFDLQLTNSAPIVLTNNLVGVMAPLSGGSVNNNTISADPRFRSATDFRPTASSPVRNSGANPNGGVTSIDLDAQDRVQGARIDRGAYEFGELFAHGFE